MMGPKLFFILRLVAVLSSILRCCHGEEDANIRKFLKSSNKKAIKSFKTVHGDIFDCIDIYKQPAFDHHALMNHTIAMRPSSYPRDKTDSNFKASSSPDLASKIELPDGGCPQGTVPIMRVDEDLLSTESIQDFHPQTETFPGFHFAIIESSQSRGVFGAQATMTTYNPSCTGGQQSKGAIWIVTQDMETRNSVSAGWMVFPGLFKDNKTRLFASWQDRYQKKGCYNTYCPGFIQVNNKIPLGIVLDTSEPGGKQVEIGLSIFKDPNKRWWLSFLDDQATYVNIGYWPEEIFIEFLVGWRAHFGGSTFGPTGEASPEMGSGRLLNDGFLFAANFKYVCLLDPNDEFVPLSSELTYTYLDRKYCYDVGHNEYRDDWHYSFLYGGPGGSSAECG